MPYPYWRTRYRPRHLQSISHNINHMLHSGDSGHMDVSIRTYFSITCHFGRGSDGHRHKEPPNRPHNVRTQESGLRDGGLRICKSVSTARCRDRAASGDSALGRLSRPDAPAVTGAPPDVSDVTGPATAAVAPALVAGAGNATADRFRLWVNKALHSELTRPLRESISHASGQLLTNLPAARKSERIVSANSAALVPGQCPAVLAEEQQALLLWNPRHQSQTSLGDSLCRECD